MYQADKAFKHWVDIGFVMRKAWSVPNTAAVMKAIWAFHMFFYISFVGV
jgi:hypothetical protein